MKIFDCHYHFKSTDSLSDEHYGSDDYRNVIINYVDEYKVVISSLPLARTTISLIFDYRDNFDYVKSQIVSGKLSALKIHSRTQKIAASDYDELLDKLHQTNTKLPIIVDAFYYGQDLEFQPNLGAIIRIAKEFPENKIIVAHCGGYEILKYFFHLRKLDNIFWDLSFSLQYLQDSSCFTDLKKLIKFTAKDRIMYGSDCPWAEPRFQVDVLKSVIHELALTPAESDQIFFKNAFHVFASR
jgi:predicted TIM-barrel fold metal-dependent hydrolase